MDGLCWADAAETNDYEWDWLQEDDALLQERIKKQEEETQTLFEMCKWLPDWLKTHRWFGIPEEVEQHLHKMEDNGDILRLQEQEEHCQMLKAKCTDIEYDAEVCKEQEVEKRKSQALHDPTATTLFSRRKTTFRHSSWFGGGKELSQHATLKAELRAAEEEVDIQRNEINRRRRSLAMHMSVDPDFRGGYRLKLFDTAGPAIRWMFLATFCRFLAIILLPFVAVKFTKCTSDLTFAEYEPWLWGPCGVWMLLMLLIEWKCFTFVVAPMLVWLKEYKIFKWKVRFRFWLPSMLFLSVAWRMDVWSQGLSLATAWRSHECSGHHKLEIVWEEAWKESFVSWFHPGKNLEFIAGLAWFVLLMQLLLYFSRAVPTIVDYSCGSEQRGYIAPLGCTRIWHADALKTFASLNNMSMVLANQRRYSTARADWKLMSGGHEEEFFRILKMDMRSMVWDMAFQNLLLPCAKLQAQTAMFALLLHMDKDKANLLRIATQHWQSLLCLCLSHLTSTMALFNAGTVLLQVKESRVYTRKERAKKMDSDAWNEYGKMAHWERLAWLIVGLQLLSELWFACKLMMAFRCESSLWNLPPVITGSWNIMEGCYELATDAKG